MTSYTGDEVDPAVVAMIEGGMTKVEEATSKVREAMEEKRIATDEGRSVKEVDKKIATAKKSYTKAKENLTIDVHKIAETNQIPVAKLVRECKEILTQKNHATAFQQLRASQSLDLVFVRKLLFNISSILSIYSYI